MTSVIDFSFFLLSIRKRSLSLTCEKIDDWVVFLYNKCFIYDVLLFRFVTQLCHWHDRFSTRPCETRRVYKYTYTDEVEDHRAYSNLNPKSVINRGRGEGKKSIMKNGYAFVKPGQSEILIGDVAQKVLISL